jgi:hypothetical protein
LDATIKFLVAGNELYLGVVVKDSSIGGGLFNRFDGVLMNIRRKNEPGRPATPFEYFYGWVTETWADPNTGLKGALPSFFGPAGGPRTPDNLQIWDAQTTVNGITNSDTLPDVSYTIEFRLNLTQRGFDVTRQEGDIVSFNISIYDVDWQWPVIPAKLSGNRTWWQGPFSSFDNNTVRIHARPDVTVSSGPVPDIAPEIIIPNAEHFNTPVIDGQLAETVWANAPSFDIRYGDQALRESYPSIGPIASGQFQPDVNGGRAVVLDPGDGTFKYFFKGDILYVGADVRDQGVWAIESETQWDGIRFMIVDRGARHPENHNLEGRELIVRFNATGQVIAEGYLDDLIAAGGAQVNVTMKPNTTINNFGDVDEGYNVELAVDLTHLGYPGNRGDGAIFIGAALLDGDSFPNPADDYGTWTWWFKERANNASPAWAYLDPNTFVPGGEAGILSRLDAIWARTTTAPITLDGRLDEPAWANAEGVRLQYNKDTGIPGSGWRNEGAAEPTDPLDATLKFLVKDNELYLGVVVKDSSIGGGLFNRFDGVLMNIRRKSEPGRPATPFEYFYGWVTETWADPNTGLKGALPSFFGPAGGPRNPDNLQIWDAQTTVSGITNSDTLPDASYTMEFSQNFTPRGFDLTRPEGDIVSFNISIYDVDWQWPVISAKLSGNRTWWQGPFSSFDNNTVRIHARPDVTVNSGPVPDIAPEVTIPNAANHDAPTIDGALNEVVWARAPSFDIRYGDNALRASYPSIGPIASGQFQPDVNGGRAVVLDPGDATFKYFFKGDILYIGADVRDQGVWAIESETQWDAIRFMIVDRTARHPENHNLEGRELIVRFNATGQVIAEGYLDDLIAAGGAQVNVSLKPNTTINNSGDIDEGFNVELAVNLTHLGYPTGRGDGVIYIGAALLDGDSFPNPADDYGTWTWWFKERANNASPAWAYMDPNTIITGVDERNGSGLPKSFALVGNYPNPFNPSTTIHYLMPEPGIVTLKIYDLLGRNAATISLGMQEAGVHKAPFDASRLGSGIYFYRLQMVTATGGKTFSTLYGKMMLLR